MRNGQLERDAIWMYGGFAVQATAGVGLQVALAARGGPEALGVFAQLLAVFLVGGQLGAVGIHDSAQRHVARRAAPGEPAGSAALSAALTGTLGGLSSVAALLWLGPHIGSAFESTELSRGLSWLAPGLGMFVVNKVLLGILNGARRMRVLAALQTLRALCLLGTCSFVVVGEHPHWWLGGAFSVSEFAVLIGALLTRPIRPPFDEPSRWLGTHLSFGTRAWGQGVLSETFFRVDLLVLGYVVSDARVGVYGLATVFVEGLWALAVLSRSIANPLLAAAVARQSAAEVSALVRRIVPWSFALLAVLSVGLYVAFPWLGVFVDEPTVKLARDALGILAIGLVLYAPMAPFEQLLVQWGRPGLHSLMTLGFSLVNLSLNLAWIPRWGIHGAAAATATSFAVAGGVLAIVTFWVHRSLPARAGP